MCAAHRDCCKIVKIFPTAYPRRRFNINNFWFFSFSSSTIIASLKLFVCCQLSNVGNFNANDDFDDNSNTNNVTSSHPLSTATSPWSSTINDSLHNTNATNKNNNPSGLGAFNAAVADARAATLFNPISSLRPSTHRPFNPFNHTPLHVPGFKDQPTTLSSFVDATSPSFYGCPSVSSSSVVPGDPGGRGPLPPFQTVAERRHPLVWSNSFRPWSSDWWWPVKAETLNNFDNDTNNGPIYQEHINSSWMPDPLACYDSPPAAKHLIKARLN